MEQEIVTKGWRVTWKENDKRQSTRVYHSKTAAEVVERIAIANGHEDVKLETVSGIDGISA